MMSFPKKLSTIILSLVFFFLVLFSLPSYASANSEQCLPHYRFTNFFTTVKVTYSQDCLEKTLKLSQIIKEVEEEINQKSEGKIKVSNLGYSLTDEGIKLNGDFESPSFGKYEMKDKKVDFTFDSQGITASIPLKELVSRK